jgi:hypothetical protein
MKSKLFFAAIFAVIIALAFGGCRLAQEDAEPGRLIGVFVSNESLDLFDIDGYIGGNLGSLISGGEVTLGGNTAKYEGRLYATKKEVKEKGRDGKTVTSYEYVFEDVKGAAIFDANGFTSDGKVYKATISGNGISDVGEDVSRDGDHDTVTLKGTMYYSLSHVGTTYHINPVYQSADGRVYATDGHAGYEASETDSEDFMYAETLTETTNVKDNGKRKNVTVSAEIIFKSMFEPKRIVILQMDKNNAVISRDEYAPGKTPEELTPKRETAYIIAETQKINGAGKRVSTREIFTEQDGELATFFLGDHGICEKAETALMWGD